MGKTREDKPVAKDGRRAFLKGAGIAGVAAVAAPVAAERAEASESRADARKARYRETEHVRRFYATNRY
jgi:hypothetical protein